MLKIHSKFTYDMKRYVEWYPIIIMLTINFALSISNILFKNIIMDDMNNFLFFASIVSLSFDDWFIREVSMEAKEYNSKIIQKQHNRSSIFTISKPWLWNKKMLSWGVDKMTAKKTTNWCCRNLRGRLGSHNNGQWRHTKGH